MFGMWQTIDHLAYAPILAAGRWTHDEEFPTTTST